jgi:hypothetical protein
MLNEHQLTIGPEIAGQLGLSINFLDDGSSGNLRLHETVLLAESLRKRW